MEELIEYINKNYKPADGARTEMYSEGNATDVFNDGEARGTAYTLKEIADIIGLETAPLEEQEFDY